MQTGLVLAEVEYGLTNRKLGSWTNSLFSSKRSVCVCVGIKVTVVVGLVGLILRLCLHIVSTEQLILLLVFKLLLARDQIKFVIVL